MEDFEFNSSKRVAKGLSGDPNQAEEQIEDNEEAQDMRLSKNIFLTSAKEEAMIRKSVTAMKKKELKTMVKHTIIAYSELWRELQGDSPDSIKVTDSLFNVDFEIQKTENFWMTFLEYFNENPQSLYFYGIYCLVIKYNAGEGHSYISKAKEILKKSISIKFKPKSLKFGLELSECQQPIAYLTKKQVKFFCNILPKGKIDCH